MSLIAQFRKSIEYIFNRGQVEFKEAISDLSAINSAQRLYVKRRITPFPTVSMTMSGDSIYFCHDFFDLPIEHQASLLLHEWRHTTQAEKHFWPMFWWNEYMVSKAYRLWCEQEAWKMNLSWWMHLGYRPVKDLGTGQVFHFNMDPRNSIGQQNLRNYIEFLADRFEKDYLAPWQRSWFREKEKSNFIAGMIHFASIA